MTDRITHSPTSKILAIGLSAAGVLFGSTVLACNTDNWNGGVSGTPLADSPPAVSRVSQLCAMIITAPGGVKDLSPSMEDAVNTRFYVKADDVTATTTIYGAFSDEDATSSLVNVTFDGSNFVFDAGAGASGNIPGLAGWNLVEMAWTSGVSMDFWVNTDANVDDPTGNVSASGGTMESVILGAPDSLSSSLTYDAYEARRTTNPGPLLICDADGSGAIGFDDIIAEINESFGDPVSVLAEGQPDCDLDGDVDFDDLIDVINIAFPPAA